MTTKKDNPNLEMWNRLEPTDPKYTKPFKGKGGFSGTAVNGTYLLKRLTEEFGPCGTGWRFVLDGEEIVEGHTLKNGDKSKLHKVLGHLEYRREAGGLSIEWCKTSPQFGQTMLVDENKYGTFTDEEAPKKSITDCISKCCVLLGLVADVHLGMFDDNKYINQRKAEVAGAEGEKAQAIPTHSPEEARALKDQDADDAKQPHPPPAKPTDEEIAFVRSVYASVKKMVSDAKDLQDIDESIEANKSGLAELRRVSPANADGLVAHIKARKAELKGGDFQDDDLP